MSRSKSRGSSVATKTLLVLSLVLTACTAPDATREISWAECPETLRSQVNQTTPELAGRITLACGDLAVPLDHTRPDGEKITLKVARVRQAAQSERIGSLIYVPGGPGLAGLADLPYLLTYLPAAVLDRFDLVTMDPRGTGGSAPINCPNLPDDLPRPRMLDVLTASGRAALTADEQRRADACLNVLRNRAPHYSTQAIAQDVDRLRAAVGDEKLTYLGISYAAKLGAEYARRFPTSLRAAVLDGPSAPSTTIQTTTFLQTKGFEDTFNEYAKGCPARPECHLGKNPREFVIKLVAQADKKPIISTGRVDHLPADGYDILDTLRGGLYNTAAWVDLDEVLYDASRGDSKGIFGMGRVVNWQPADDSEPADPQDANYVINCNDVLVGPTDDLLRTTATQMARDLPVFGSHISAALLACSSWQPQRSVLDPPVAPTPNRVLVVGTTHDAATPYAGAVALTEIMGNATLLTWEGKNHTALGHSLCIADHVATYLIELAVPAEGTRCA